MFVDMTVLLLVYRLTCCSAYRYQPPCKKGVLEQLIWLSAAATKRIGEEIMELIHEECLDLSISGGGLQPLSFRFGSLLMPCMCCAGDIWSENGISMFALTGYWIDNNWKFKEVLLHCVAFTDVTHSGANIMKTTLDIMVSCHDLNLKIILILIQVL